jgi:hypothetical protein
VALVQNLECTRDLVIYILEILVIYTSDTNTMASYLMKIIELRDQFATIGMKVGDVELVSIAANVFSSTWENL